MTNEDHQSYFFRAIADLGQAAHDPERMAIWCYEHPPRKPLPKTSGVRDKNIYVSRRIWQCLYAVAGTLPCVDGLVESILLQWIEAHIPEVKKMYERHEQEIEARIAELRKQEPELQGPTWTQEIAAEERVAEHTCL